MEIGLTISIERKKLRFEIDKKHQFYKKGIDESMSLDQTTHSIFGASKTGADLLVQEYGRYFNLKTVTFRGGCLTGENHSGAELHGFLSFLVKSIISGKNIQYLVIKESKFVTIFTVLMLLTLLIILLKNL